LYNEGCHDLYQQGAAVQAALPVYEDEMEGYQVGHSPPSHLQHLRRCVLEMKAAGQSSQLNCWHKIQMVISASMIDYRQESRSLHTPGLQVSGLTYRLAKSEAELRAAFNQVGQEGG
jgi:hypothetical protein